MTRPQDETRRRRDLGGELRAGQDRIRMQVPEYAQVVS